MSSSIFMEIPSKTSNRLGIYISLLSGGCREKHVVKLFIANCLTSGSPCAGTIGYPSLISKLLRWKAWSFGTWLHNLCKPWTSNFDFFYYFQMIMKGSPTNAEIGNH